MELLYLYKMCFSSFQLCQAHCSTSFEQLEIDYTGTHHSQPLTSVRSWVALKTDWETNLWFLSFFSSHPTCVTGPRNGQKQPLKNKTLTCILSPMDNYTKPPICTVTGNRSTPVAFLFHTGQPGIQNK